MDISELKEVWQQMEQKLTRQNSIQIALLRDKQLSNTRSKLKPLYWGMTVQILFGLASVLYAAPFWIRHLDTPALWVNGLIVHAYGLLIMVLAGQIMYKISHIDISSPVVTIQRQVLELKKSYIRSGWIVGMPWWALWLPFTVIVAHSKLGLFADGMPYSFIWILGFCVLGMALTIGAVMWSQNPKRPELAAKTEAMLARVSLTKTQQSLDELLRFEQQDEVHNR